MPTRPPIHGQRQRQQAVKQARRAYDAARGSAASRGYGWRWRNPQRTGAADVYLANNPLCVQCMAEGATVAATVVDHIKPHRGNSELFWDQDNWQPLCKRHHDAKTASGQ